MATSIGDYMARLGMTRGYVEQSAARIDADWRLSDAAKKEAHDGLRWRLHESVTDAVQGIFGTMAPTGLEGGEFWKQREALKAKLQEARDSADSLDPARLANTYRRVESMATKARNVGELATWYTDRADSYERRALQDTAAEIVPARHRGDPSLGGLLATLEVDRAQALTTPAVAAVESAIVRLHQDAYEAHGELSRSLDNRGGAFSIDPAARVLSSVSVDARMEDVSRLDSPVTYTIEKVAGASGVYWRDGAMPE